MSVMIGHQGDLEVLMAVKVPLDTDVANLCHALGLEEVREMTCCWKVFPVRRHEELVGFVEILNGLRIARNIS
jgi:hypothetical protein